jgi:hypothetical protein
MSRNSQDVALLSPEERDLKSDDLEAGKSHGDSKDQNLDHEYSIPSAVKFTWLGTYFFFSLVLTLYNKLVLGKVCPHVLPAAAAFSLSDRCGLVLPRLAANADSAQSSFTSHGF